MRLAISPLSQPLIHRLELYHGHNCRFDKFFSSFFLHSAIATASGSALSDTRVREREKERGDRVGDGKKLWISIKNLIYEFDYGREEEEEASADSDKT